MMNIEAISFLSPVSMPSILPQGELANMPVASGFGAWFQDHLADVNAKMVAADKGVQQLAAGDASNLHQVMIGLEESKLSLQMMMQVRNHLLDAFHEIEQMQL
jgi:flagellar hook-basal body complex protein FliE